MLINDIVPPKKRQTHGQAALQRVQQLHSATKLTTLAKNPPQLRPELRKYSSFDILPAKTPGLRRRPQISYIKPQANHPTAVKTAPAQQPRPQSVRQPKPAETTIQSKPKTVAAEPTPGTPLWRRLLDFAQYPLIAGAAILAASNSTAGQVMIGLYALLGILVRISSKYTFGGALILLVGIPFFQVLHQSGVSEKSAIYAYEMLVVGTLQAIIETWLENRSNKIRIAR